MRKDSNWKEYFEKTKNAKPRPDLINALFHVKNKNSALDFGAGALNDSAYLLSLGFKHVTAVDVNPVGMDVLENFPIENFSYKLVDFDSFEFPKNEYDLVNAQYSLPFSSKESLPNIFEKIKESLIVGGVFVGQLFGLNDEWSSNEKMNFHTKESAQKLLSGFNIISFEEEEKDSKTAMGDSKHWHIFHFIVYK